MPNPNGVPGVFSDAAWLAGTGSRVTTLRVIVSTACLGGLRNACGLPTAASIGAPPPIGDRPVPSLNDHVCPPSMLVAMNVAYRALDASVRASYHMMTTV